MFECYILPKNEQRKKWRPRSLVENKQTAR